MEKLTTLIAAGIIFSACQRNNNESFKDELTTQKKIVIPDNENSIARNSEEDQYNTFYGPVVQMGEGHARSWVNITHDDKALAIGIEMTEGALQQHDESDDGHGPEFVFTLHQKAKGLTPFDHLGINWNPGGHPPPGIYTVPHFDFHFYKMPLADRLAIPSYATSPGGFNNIPPAGYIPPFYRPGEPIEKMGKHWGDLLAPEFQGQPFTHTLIYGSYKGKVIFLEPMITLATLQSGATVHKEIRQPQLFDPINTYYPGRYNIWKNDDNNRHYIALDQMLWR